MKTKTILVCVIGTAIITGGGFGIYRVGMHQGMQMTSMPAASTAASAGSAQPEGAVDPSTGKKALYWHDPMVPGPKFDKPGKSPFMDMDLVPVYAEEGADEGTVRISPRIQQNLGIRTAIATREDISRSIRAVGSVAYDERDIALVQARSNGYVEKLYVRATLDPVEKGQALAELYVPDWVAAQEEYLTVKQMGGEIGAGMLEAARNRMRLAGMTDEQIGVVEKSGKVVPRLTIRAPRAGVITELSAREGMTVMSGAPLFRINGLATVWVEAEIPETVAGQIRPGTPVEATSQAAGRAALKGKVSAILPQVDPSTRTVKARIELDNRGQRLLPGMFVTVEFAPLTKEDLLTVPTEAVIRTGERDVVIVMQDEGGFAPVEVQIGTEANGKTVIRKGLDAGQKVVASGQFLIDSEASLKGAIGRMSAMPAENAESGGSNVHQGEGKVESIEDAQVTLSHGPIPSLKWGEMTMPFMLPKEGMPKNVAVGDMVTFTIRPMKDGMYEIVEIKPAGLNAQPARIAKSPTQPTASTIHRGEGRVESIDDEGVILSHGPIPSLKWGPMTMGFDAPAKGMPMEIAVGDTVTFEFRGTPEGTYQIVSIAPRQGAGKGVGK